MSDIQIAVPDDFRLRLSPSKMIVWDQCQRHLQATIQKTTRDAGNIYSAVGSAAHSVIERINKGLPVDRENALRETVVEICKAEDIGLEWPKSYKESNKYIQDYEVPYGWKLVSGEQKHVLNMGSYDFSYIIDSTWSVGPLTELTSNAGGHTFQLAAGERYQIVDYKTSAAKPKTNLQLQLYATLEHIRLGLDPEQIDAMFWMLRDGKQIAVKINAAVIEQTKQYMASSVALMLHMLKSGEDFPATPGDCYFCRVEDCPERI